ncbi:MAG: sugar phosphate isomerase/epimerase [Chloroflexi bacterium]|nr:sugar phosphate isomerase/epimerase [Chloroflexota bacterium]
MLGPNELSLCCGTVLNASFQDLVQAAAAGGFKAISIWPRHYEGARAAGLTDRDMRHMLEDHGLVVSELDPLLTWLPGVDPARLQFHYNYDEESFFRVADALGARSLNAVYQGAEASVERCAEAFGRVCDRAARHGLLVSLEFLPWSSIGSVKTALAVIRLAGCSNGGIQLDTWHHFRSGGNAHDLRALPGNAIVATQFNDAGPVAAADLRWESRHGRLLPGRGAIDLVQIVRALDAIGCRVPIGVEVFSDELNDLSPAEAGRRAGDSMRAILAEARNN